MIYTVVGMKNQYPGTFEKEVYLFHNNEEAYAMLRRNMRDLVISGDINLDRINEMGFFVIGEFDSENGRFDNYEQQTNMSIESMIWDLVADDDAIPMVGDEND